jgi:predicted lipid-binding transport protein (Tim44 family)
VVENGWTPVRSAFVEIAGNFGSHDFPSLRVKLGKEVSKMVEQALDAMDKAEKVMRKRDLDLDTGKTARLFKSPRT